MADYYTLFSFAIKGLTEPERAWLDELLHDVNDEQEPRLTCILTGNEGENADDCTTHDHEGLGDVLADPDQLGFAFSFEQDGSLWVHADESGMTENAANVVQAFLAKFRPDDTVGFEWANTCSRPLLDAYGGGAVFITATEIRWNGSGHWLAQQEATA